MPQPGTEFSSGIAVFNACLALFRGFYSRTDATYFSSNPKPATCTLAAYRVNSGAGLNVSPTPINLQNSFLIGESGRRL